jgi:acetyl-CoA acetyltransferase
MRKRSKSELPTPNIRRWTFGQKGAVLEAIRRGALTAEQARERYGLSVEELDAWQRDFERHGLYGLRATRVQVYRDEKRKPNRTG